MARLATLAVLLLSLAVASCRVLEAESAISDDQGPPNTVVLAQDDQADVAAAAEVTPTVAEGEGVLRLPSHRRPCHLHRRLWWARHHGLSHHRGAFSGPGVVPTVAEQEPREAELVAVAEPDPDSRPDTDAEQKQFHGEEEGEAATAWKVEMLRRFRHAIRFHHRHHHEHDGEERDDQEKVNDEGADTKPFGRFHHRHHLRYHREHEEDDDHEQEDKDEVTNTKLFHRFHHHHAHDGDREVDEVEELAKRLSEAIMRRRVSHGGHPHHHHHHHGAAAEGGVKKWLKGLMNRF